MPARAAYSGPALFSYGFRPFFLAACCFGLAVIPVWLLIWRGDLALGGPFAPVDWHIHEMIFGYGAAVVAGFLFTAVPNWTGRLPTRGWPLIVLSALWLLGRFAVWGALPFSATTIMAIDCAFLLLLGLAIAVEIVAGRNWRNLMVVGPLLMLAAANAAFHLEAQRFGSVDLSRRLGLAILIFLIMVMGGRIIPSFTRNWLAQRGASNMPVPFGRFDRLCLAASAPALAVWTGWPEATLTAALLTLAGLLHGFRLSRWRGAATWRSPLLLMLHVAYAFIPLGLLAAAGAALSLFPAATGLHLFGIGAIAGMTVAVMMRATRGHTGRPLVAGPWLTVAFALIVLAAIVRAVVPDADFAGLDGITLSATFWTAGFAIFCVRVGPWLVSPNARRRQPNRPAA